MEGAGRLRHRLVGQACRHPPGRALFTLGETNPAIEETQTLLAKFGYEVPASGYLDGTTRDAVAAFQRHFRPQRVDGIVDVSTLATLKALVAAYEARLTAPSTS